MCEQQLSEVPRAALDAALCEYAWQMARGGVPPLTRASVLHAAHRLARHAAAGKAVRAALHARCAVLGSGPSCVPSAPPSDDLLSAQAVLGRAVDGALLLQVEGLPAWSGSSTMRAAVMRWVQECPAARSAPLPLLAPIAART